MLSEIVKLEVRSNPKLCPMVRKFVDQCGRMAGLNENDSHMLTLAVDEAFCNIIRHTYKMKIDEQVKIFISVEEKDYIEIQLFDQGTPVNPENIKGRQLNDVKPGGLGTHFINSIMDEVEFQPQVAGNILRMRKNISDPRTSTRQKIEGYRDPQLLQTLLNINQSLHSILDLDELLQTIVSKTKAIIQSEGTSVILLDEESDELFFHTTLDEDQEVVERLQTLRFPVTQGIAGRVMQTGKPILVGDVQRDPDHFRGVDEKSGGSTESLMYAPLKVRDRVIGVLSAKNKKGGFFNEEDLEVLTAIAGTVSLSIDNARAHDALQNMPNLSETMRIRKEMDSARLMHSATLPQELPDIPGLDISGICVPAHEVGGDYYDFFPLGECYAIAIGDVSGHGLEAGMMVSMAHSCLFTQIGFSSKIEDVMSSMNRVVYGAVKKRLIMTFFFSIYDPASRQWIFSNAGHPSPYHYSQQEDKWQFIEEGEFPLGVFEGHRYESYSWQLSPGDIVVLYSDGIIEASNDRRERYGFVRFEQLLSSKKTWNSAKEIQNAILGSVKSFCQMSAPSDDRTLLVIMVE